MIKKIFGILLLLLVFVSFVFAGKPEGDKNDGKKQINKTMEDGLYSTIAINNLEMWFSNNGDGSYNPRTAGAGCYFPKGSSKTCIFEDGPILSGLVGGSLRMVGSIYNHSLQAGPSIPNVDPTNPKYKIYQIRKDWQNLPNGVKQISGPGLTKAHYQSNYDNWPIDEGAPYTIENGKKVPKFIGDEQAWFVMNDLNKSKMQAFYGSQPIGTEWQCLVWGYAMPGPLGNILFKKYTIINKGDADVEEAYLSYWSDVDIGDGNDDLCGCDTLLSVGYVYNGSFNDGTYGVAAPAVGYDYFQGPTVKSSNPSDVAIWNFGKKQGYKNLPMTSFTFFANSNSGLGSDYTDPAFTISGGYEFYNLQKGLKKNGTTRINPQTNKTSKFIFPGDPVTNTGWVDGPYNAPSFPSRDVRIMISSGPFTLARGDTQELVVGIIVGQGADRLSSVTVMRNYDLIAQKFYNENFTFVVLPLEPQNNSIINTLNTTLIWNSSEIGCKYRLQVSTNPEFTNLVLDQLNLESTSFHLVGLQNNTKYYWRVCASSSIATSNWSEVWSFSTIDNEYADPFFGWDGHLGDIYTIAFSKNGKMIVSGGNDNTVVIWDVSTGKSIKNLFGHSNYVRTISFSPDGTKLASGSKDGTIILWDVNWGTIIKTLVSQNNGVYSLDFSPDGTKLASGDNNRIKIWDLSSGTVIKTLNGNNSFILSLDFSPDGRYLVSGGYNNYIELWDLYSGMLVRTFEGHNSSVYCLSFSPDGTKLVSGGDDNKIKLWDFNSGMLIKTFEGHNNSVYCFSFSPDGTKLATGSYDGTIKIWNVNNSNLLKTIYYYYGYPRSIAYNNTGTLIAAGGNGYKNIRLYDVSFLTNVNQQNSKEVLFYKISQNYPNPFNPSTRIDYSIPENSFVELKIYDTFGKEIETLINKFQTRGTYSFQWEPQNIATGVYFYRIKAGKYSETKKMVYIK